MKSLFLICIIFCIASSLEAQKKVVCYYGTWSVWRPGHGKFEVHDIDPNICTHIIYTFFGASPDGQIRYLDPYLDLPDNWGKDNINKFIQLKSINPSVKLLASVGGWNEGSEVFSQIASTQLTRHAFAINAANFLTKWGFDGIEVNWEYPAQRDGDAQHDKRNLVLLLDELKQVLQPYQQLLAIGVAATENSASISYDIPNVVQHVDFVNLMSYDLHGSWEDHTGIHGALFPIGNQANSFNVDDAVRYWLSSGCPKEKLILGIATYGRSFTLADVNDNGVGARATGAGFDGAFVPEPGFMAFNEICFTQHSWTRHWVEVQKVPYVVRDNQWVGYDDAESVTIKLNYVLDNDLGGVMFWSLETDDFGNLCGSGRYPLISLASKHLNGEVEPTSPASLKSTTPSASTSAWDRSTPPIILPPDSTSKPVAICCPYSGLFKDPRDCTKFYSCDHGTAHHMQCPSDLYFDDQLKVCNWPRNVKCDV